MHTFIRACIYYLSLLSGTKNFEKWGNFCLKFNFILLPFFIYLFFLFLTDWPGGLAGPVHGIAWHRSRFEGSLRTQSVASGGQSWTRICRRHPGGSRSWRHCQSIYFCVSILISLDMKTNTSFYFPFIISNQPPTHPKTRAVFFFSFFFFKYSIQLF